jgi:anaerobic magnesium-protoporphyrin IX monomethyl ester cyclase
MKIILIYPPCWKIVTPGETPYPPGEGPYEGWQPGTPFDGDELRVPYGLLSLAAQARRAGHQVEVWNLYSFPWKEIVGLLQHKPADLYGLSCFTINRRGTYMLADEIRRLYPGAFVLAGGPHAGALPREMLSHYNSIDAVAVGEAEDTFLEVLGRLEANAPLQGLPGLVYRREEVIEEGPRREPIADLDSLASPYDDFSGDAIISARGCPGRCTFCTSPALWGHEVRFHSPAYLLDMVEVLIRKHGRRTLAVKDDTFTFDRGRVLQICEGIQKRDLHFLWSCDTRADALDEEVLKALRTAGCQRISLGVESTAPEILRNINKRTTPEKVLEVTGLAKRFGFQVRYYMIAGYRGETTATLNASIDFVMKAKTNQFIFSFLMLFPGTMEFALAEKKGMVDREIFFAKDWPYFRYPLPENQDAYFEQMIDWIYQHPGVQEVWDYDIAQRMEILDRLPRSPSAHLDLGAAYYQAGLFPEAKRAFNRARQLGFPLPGIVANYLACIASHRRDFAAALRHFDHAYRDFPLPSIKQNLDRLSQWASREGRHAEPAPPLTVQHGFELEPLREQPLMPSPYAV